MDEVGFHKLNSWRSRETSAICTFSVTVIELKVAAIWNVRPTPRRQISRGRLPAISWPSKRIEPELGFNWPLSMLKQVDLPAPFGPISASNWPAFRSKETSSTALTPPNDFARWDTRRRVTGPPRRVAKQRFHLRSYATRACPAQTPRCPAETRLPAAGSPHPTGLPSSRSDA